VTTPGGPVHLSLAFNPSHLEIVNPVVEGSVKARMDRRGDKDGARCCRCWCTATPPLPARAW
jgi:2-oxoglutarate dehydrogenase E1 component